MTIIKNWSQYQQFGKKNKALSIWLHLCIPTCVNIHKHMLYSYILNDDPSKGIIGDGTT